jgi:hypothetical protein
MSFRDGEKNQCNWFSPQITASLASQCARSAFLGSFRRRGTERVARPLGPWLGSEFFKGVEVDT